jgi:hypothetical protein
VITTIKDNPCTLMLVRSALRGCYAVKIILCWLSTFRRNVCGLSSRGKQTCLHLGGNYDPWVETRNLAIMLV